MKVARGILALLCVAALLPACERSYIEGTVTDVRGAALPGVVVRVMDSSSQDLTDGLGQYRLAAPRGTVQIAFSKTGYTTAELAVSDSVRSKADASMWPLPLNPGIYIVTDLHFTSATWVVPKEYDLKDGTRAFGAVLPKELQVATTEPFIVAYRTTRYNARLSRLISAEAQNGEETPADDAVWVEAGTMAAALEPLDQPEGQLLQLQVGRPLEPGVYGVHWGAMSSYTTLDTRVFLFRVPEPPAEGEATIVPPAAKTSEPGDAAATPQEPTVASEKKQETPPEPEPIEPTDEPSPPPTNP